MTTVALPLPAGVDLQRYQSRIKKIDYPDYGEIELDPELDLVPYDGDQLPVVERVCGGLDQVTEYSDLAVGDVVTYTAPCPECSQPSRRATCEGDLCRHTGRVSVFYAKITEIVPVYEEWRILNGESVPFLHGIFRVLDRQVTDVWISKDRVQRVDVPPGMTVNTTHLLRVSDVEVTT